MLRWSFFLAFSEAVLGPQANFVVSVAVVVLGECVKRFRSGNDPLAICMWLDADRHRHALAKYHQLSMWLSGSFRRRRSRWSGQSIWLWPRAQAHRLIDSDFDAIRALGLNQIAFSHVCHIATQRFDCLSVPLTDWQIAFYLLMIA